MTAAEADQQASKSTDEAEEEDYQDAKAAKISKRVVANTMNKMTRLALTQSCKK